MKRTLLFFAAIAVLALGMSSCNKEEIGGRTDFTATADSYGQQGEKTTLDGHSLIWEHGDQIVVIGADGLKRICEANEYGTNYSTFGYVEIPAIAVSGPYTAFYPATICETPTQITLPAVQQSATGGLTGFPMYAYSTDNHLLFRNLCSVICFNLSGNDATNITNISITTDGVVSGTFDLSSDEIPDLSAVCGGNTVSMHIASPSGSTYYMYMPAGTYSTFEITLSTADGRSFTKVATSAMTLVKNQITTINLSNVNCEYALYYTTNDNDNLSDDIDWLAEDNNTTASILTLASGRYKAVFAAPITEISWGVFSQCADLTSITIPSCVTTIGDEAFWGCNNLTNVTIPNSVTTIGQGSFSWCNNLANITIPNSVTTIDARAFEESGITSIVIPNGVTEIAYGTFQNCRNLTSVTIPNSVTTINENAFAWSENLANVNIPNGVTTIGPGAFEGCCFTHITIPNSVTTIGHMAFACTDLTHVTIPSGVTTIESMLFYCCDALIDATIPSGVTTIEGMAFSTCQSLTHITIPNSVTEIYGSAFDNCWSLSNFTCLATEPPQLIGLIGVAEDCILHVPSGSVAAYQASDWNEYFEGRIYGDASASSSRRR